MSTPQLSPSRAQLERILAEPISRIVLHHSWLMKLARTDEDALALAHQLRLELLRLALDLGAALGVQTFPARGHTDPRPEERHG